MRPLLRAMSAESLKMRGTLALWMCLIAPATVMVLYVLQISFSSFKGRSPMAAADAWGLFTQSVLGLWCFLMLPLFITLQSALLAGLEHREQQWKHLLALPVPRRVHYLAKLWMLALMVLGAFGLLCLLIPIGGWSLTFLQPALGIAGPPPWAALLKASTACFAASLLMIALHTWIALRWRSFTVAVAIGMSATVIGFLVGQSERFGHWYPWSMPVQVLAGKGQHLEFVVTGGILGGIVIAALGLVDYLRREVS